ncbi:hypothetical protein AOZ07_11355 [Glutamicibacter halophytocola]|nr:hypothetical protein AOZ07_11355 [Glutamicibacter halophytocola]
MADRSLPRKPIRIAFVAHGHEFLPATWRGRATVALRIANLIEKGEFLAASEIAKVNAARYYHFRCRTVHKELTLSLTAPLVGDQPRRDTAARRLMVNR